MRGSSVVRDRFPTVELGLDMMVTRYVLLDFLGVVLTPARLSVRLLFVRCFICSTNLFLELDRLNSKAGLQIRIRKYLGRTMRSSLRLRLEKVLAKLFCLYAKSVLIM